MGKYLKTHSTFVYNWNIEIGIGNRHEDKMFNLQNILGNLEF